ncbi:uncharacterized protein [Palaemon carinicauda]|uniref:uncharacterized protein n=1 Tax=Palaemon carinicauda TaxID=392227 RepID=UPI0035B69529
MSSTIKSERGKDILVDALQYMYHKNGSNSDKSIIYWECAKRKQNSCKARVHTKSKSENYELIKTTDEHNHEASKSTVDAKSAVAKLKDDVASSNSATRSLVASCFSTLDTCSRAEVQNVQHLSRNVRRWRQQTISAPVIPRERIGFCIPTNFQNLSSGEKFLQYDSGAEDHNRILIFATEVGLDHLRRYRNWAVDGTFKVSPGIFYQLFTIHVQVDNCSFPRIFGLLPNKTQETYERFYNKIHDILQETPTTIMSDFEKGSFNGIKGIFPDAIVSGCFFHFCQANYRKIVELGFKVRYHNDNEFCLKIRCFSSLAFLPIEDVPTGFEELSEDEDIPEEFLAYFEVNYIGVMRGRGGNRRRASPLFPISIWNMHIRTQMCMPRTNNSLEGFHSALSNNAEKHPHIWKLIDRLIKEEVLSQTKVIQMERGDERPTNTKYKKINKRLEQIVSRYNPDDKITFLRSIGYNVHIF